MKKIKEFVYRVILIYIIYIMLLMYLYRHESEFSCFEQARKVIGEGIGEDYNQLYAHSASGYRSPGDFYQQLVQLHQAALAERS